MAVTKEGKVGKVKKRKADVEHPGNPKKRTRTVDEAASKSNTDSDVSEASDGVDDDNHEAMDRILLLEEQIFDSKANMNNIPVLIGIAKNGSSEKEAEALAAAVSLCRIFIRLMGSELLSTKEKRSKKELRVISWLKNMLLEYQDILKRLLLREDLAGTALTMSMRVLPVDKRLSENENTFPLQFFTEVVALVIVQQTLVEGLLDEFVEKWVDEYDDVRYYTFVALRTILDREDATTSTAPEIFRDTFKLLNSIQGVPEPSEKLDTFYLGLKSSHVASKPLKLRTQAQGAWMALFKFVQTEEQREQVLEEGAANVAPWFIQPELLMDFLSECYDAQGRMSMMALSGAFYLMQETNLEFPEFYNRVYSLIDEELLSSKNRSKFFRLMETLLKSSHLPATLAASFMKRLARLCLHAPPSAIVLVVPWMYNTFRDHPQTTFMMHRTPRKEEELERAVVEDPFLPEEEDPLETKAIDSCVWEIVHLQDHWHANVAKIAKIVAEQFTKQFYNLEDFLDHSYSSLLEQFAVDKEFKRPPAVEYFLPKHIFLQPSDDEVRPDHDQPTDSAPLVSMPLIANNFTFT
jgi:U3 small nucleolar RNA-associated protein 19